MAKTRKAKSSKVRPDTRPAAQEGFKALFMPADESGCGFDRVEVPAAAMSRLGGWRTVVQPPLERTRLIDVLEGNYDLIVGQRVSTPEMLTFLQATVLADDSPAYIYEIDDNLFEVDPWNHNAYALYSQDWVKQNLLSAMYWADAVTVSTNRLADIVQQVNPHVIVLPNYLPGDTFSNPERPANPEVVRVVWAGGSSHEQDLRLVLPALYEVAEHPRAELHLMGQDWRQQDKWSSEAVAAAALSAMGITPRFGPNGLPRLPIPIDPLANFSTIDLPPYVYTPWRQDKREYLKLLTQYDIGLAPLLPTPFGVCKTWVKALEYASQGIPTVATNVQPYNEFVEHGVTGFLANDNDEFARYVKLLIDNDDLRHELGANAYKKSLGFTIEGRVRERCLFYESVIRNKQTIRQNKLRDLQKARAIRLPQFAEVGR